MTKTLNVVIAHYRPDVISGAENSIADLVSQLDPRFKITMLIPKDGNLADFYRKRGIPVWIKHVDTPRRLYPGLHTLQSLALARDLKKRSIDLVLCNTLPAAERVIDACRFAGLPRIVYMRDYIKDTSSSRRVLSHADAVLCISRDVQSHLKDMVDPEKVWLAYNYIRPDAVLERYRAHQTSGNRLLPFPEETPIVGLVGRITAYKQPDLFVRAAPHVLREVPQARFVVIGSAQDREKPYEESLHRLAADLGVQEQVQFLGLRKDAVELTSELTVSCLASGREPLGRVVLEAHLMNVPVVVPDRGGPAEIVENGVTGLHFNSIAADAEKQLASQVIRLLKDPSLAQCLAARAQEHVLSTFANRKHVQIQEEYFDRVYYQRHSK